MVITFKKKNFVWIILWGIILVFASQKIPEYQYQDLRSKVEDFIKAKIIHQRLILVDDLPYKPGVGTYKEIKVEDGRRFPLLVIAQDYSKMEGQLEVNAIVNKLGDNRFFEVRNDEFIGRYEIRSLDREINSMKRSMLIAAVLITLGGILKVNIEVKKDGKVIEI